MKNNCRCLLLMLFLVGFLLLIMGAGNKVIAGVTSSMTKTSVDSKITAGIVSRATGSIANSVKNGVTTSVISKGTCTLSTHVEELVNVLKFDRQVFIIVKAMAQEPIRRLIGYDENGYQIVAPGIVVQVSGDKTDSVLAALRKKLAPLHYMPFVVEKNEGLKTDKIGIIKGMDQYEIIRIMHPDDNEDDIANQDIIDRLKEWESNWPLTIIGTDGDWVELEFKTLPMDLKSFLEEVNDFSPDAIEQGPGTLERLIAEIKRTNRLRLLWE